jgi:transposase InsO family protein
VAESFFGTLKVELIHERSWTTRAAAEAAITEYIEDFYNVRRRHSSLGYLSPLAFELRAAAAGERGGSAPAPPFTLLEGRGQEVPGLAG